MKDIIPLNADTCLDGSVNSIRRCFVKDVQLDNAYWDEVITEVKPNKKDNWLFTILRILQLQQEAYLLSKFMIELDQMRQSLF